MLNRDTLIDVVQTIIAKQATIIGPLAFEQAKKVDGLHIDDRGRLDIDLTLMNGQELLTRLVSKFSELFGYTSIEVCKDAVKESSHQVSENDLPPILQ